jgi:hypothetical protein
MSAPTQWCRRFAASAARKGDAVSWFDGLPRRATGAGLSGLSGLSALPSNKQGGASSRCRLFVLFFLFTKTLTSLTPPTSGATAADRAGNNPANKSDNPAMSLARLEVLVDCVVERCCVRNEISRRTVAGGRGRWQTP